MEIDLIKQLGYKAFDSRLKRISDHIAHNVKKLYKEIDLDVEPNWYLIFMLLKEHDHLSIANIAERIGYAHTSVFITVTKMSERGYVRLSTDKTDKRKQLVSLTTKATKSLPMLEQIWASCEAAILQILEDDLGIFSYLDKVDSNLEKTSFHQRFKQEYLKRTSAK
ncbi:MarR family winged helix-turn-helix transcriptional regulator [Chitinophaga nivalis]|uniref:MarR family transcriptional regulator n=1 Tax=Chitinophaga nivalis TaxID=2991709 RepID=A0ABT3IH77_9BACT|nr:helix-turn-helix domain-containing protein [Chitinophaga nivalis]MCW3466994.1 MarR family transcriptional regulator [Chitinophaga nivalis]MCW3483315.1 MarR family transcriptional regulator [Chitinophaga nivalis]